MASTSARGPCGLLLACWMAIVACAPDGEVSGPLLPVPEPDLTATEPLVRAQLESERRELDQARRAGSGDSTELGAAYGRMGKLYHAYDLLEPAEACYRNARSLQPAVADWSYLLGLLLERRGRFDEAVAALQTAVRLAPEDAAVHLHLGQSELAANRLSQARRHFSGALEADSSCQAARFGLGEVARREGDLETAADQLLRVLAEQPTAEQVHYPLAQMLQRLGRSAEARSHFQQAARRALSVGGRPQCADPLDLELAELRTGAAAAMRRGMLLSLAGNADEETKLLRAAIEQSPSDAALRQRLGTILLEAGDLEGAEEQLTEAVALAPRDPEILLTLGVAAARRQDFETAVAHFRTAVEINPESVHYRMQLGQALRQLGRCQEAIEQFSEVLDAEGSHRQALVQRSACLADLGRSREAGLDMARLLDSHPPDDLEERLRLASMLLSLGEDETALRHFRIIAESPAAPPVRAAAHLLIGQVQLRRGQNRAAEESFRLALALDPRLADRLPRGR